MNEDPVIRPFAAGDRPAVRRIACDTADCGQPVERFFPDREIFADLLTRYYTDFEPESSQVGEQGGVVVGYLNGCLETTRHDHLMKAKVLPAVLAKTFFRGTWFRPQAMRFVLRNMGVWVSHRYEPPLDLTQYPAHLHVNLAPDFRGHGLGRMLVETFLNHVADRGVAGVHASVREDNEKGRRFFERLGFREIAMHPVLRLEKARGVVYGVLYGLNINGPVPKPEFRNPKYETISKFKI
jgi:ribosomal protein S18 acetylase RimI-like enzyme